MLQQHKTQRLLMVAVLAIGLVFAGLLGTSMASAQGPGSGGVTPYPGQGNPGWSGGHMMGGHGMMGDHWAGSSTTYSGHGMQCCGNGSMGNRMMGDWGMMGGWTPPVNLLPAGQPLTFDSAVTVANAYLSTWGANPTLKLGEVMEFTQNFYAQAIESSTGRAAFEFLIDPTNGAVWPEPGPNMMWNLRYGMMNNHMGIYTNGTDRGENMKVSPDKAREYAQAFLDRTQPNTKISDDATAFYGYYTLDFSREGKVVGMLSVNGYTGEVWLHTWHGDFVKETSSSQ